MKQPVYVGARACAQCHEGKAAGNQYSHWLGTAHAQAWASLALPEAKAMARLAGITDEPEKAPVCLGCHATAAEAEKWERDPAFRIEDGVQCEKCHGPGSEYMSEKVMRDPEAARRAGLRRFEKRDCAVCHYVKGSHAAVHQKAQLDVAEAWQRLAHAVPADSSPGTESRHRPDARDGRRPEVRRRQRLWFLPPGPAARLPAQPLAHERARAGVRGALDAEGGRDRPQDGRDANSPNSPPPA